MLPCLQVFKKQLLYAKAEVTLTLLQSDPNPNPSLNHAKGHCIISICSGKGSHYFARGQMSLLSQTRMSRRMCHGVSLFVFVKVWEVRQQECLVTVRLHPAAVPLALPTPIPTPSTTATAHRCRCRHCCCCRCRHHHRYRYSHCHATVTANPTPSLSLIPQSFISCVACPQQLIYPCSFISCVPCLPQLNHPCCPSKA